MLLMLVASCASPKKFVYLNDMEPGVGYKYDSAHEAVIRPNDRLRITVTCKQPELAIPFNRGNAVNVNADGSVSQSTSPDEDGYKVDSEGNIDFPILGTVHLDGLTTRKASELIRDMIVEGGYIKSPMVSIDFKNFKYTVWALLEIAASVT